LIFQQTTQQATSHKTIYPLNQTIWETTRVSFPFFPCKLICPLNQTSPKRWNSGSPRLTETQNFTKLSQQLPDLYLCGLWRRSHPPPQTLPTHFHRWAGGGTLVEGEEVYSGSKSNELTWWCSVLTILSHHPLRHHSRHTPSLVPSATAALGYFQRTSHLLMCGQSTPVVKGTVQQYIVSSLASLTVMLSHTHSGSLSSSHSWRRGAEINLISLSGHWAGPWPGSPRSNADGSLASTPYDTHRRVNKFGTFCQNLTDSGRAEFKMRWITVHKLKKFKK
jgi:hypothetical protein